MYGAYMLSASYYYYQFKWKIHCESGMRKKKYLKIILVTMGNLYIVHGNSKHNFQKYAFQIKLENFICIVFTD